MPESVKWPRLFALAVALLVVMNRGGVSQSAPPDTALARRSISTTWQASILVYHRFAPTVTDSMTVRTSTFAWQLEYLRAQGYTVVPLRMLLARLDDPSAPLPDRAVVITVDDGHRSVFSEMLPLARRFETPVTLFIYPSAISNASYAMAWDQLRTLRATGLFDVQSHTFWHPNFRIERQRLSAAAYDVFVSRQLVLSRDTLKRQMSADIDLLAWPFGLYDAELVAAARSCGYVAAFTLDRRVVTERDASRMMELPRFLVTDGARGASFRSMLPEESR